MACTEFVNITSNMNNSMRVVVAHLGKDVANLKHFQLGASFGMLRLIYCVGNDHLIQGTGIDPLDCIAAQDAVSNQCIDLACAFLFQQLSRSGDGVACVRQVIDDKGDFPSDVAHKHHGSILTIGDLGGSSLFVDERKVDTQGIGYRSCPLGASSV